MEFTGKKKFKVSNGTFESVEIYAVFEVDFDFPDAKEKIVEMSMFWSDSPDLSDSLKTHLEFILPIATNALYHASQNNWRLSTVKSMDKHLWNEQEGFAYGQYVGIKLVDFYADEVCADIFEVEEIKE
ncbi:TPA: hypothetical protein QB527_001233 [Pasteurella multocida]|nr:hypothetical protein [Pasteurella multocida]HDR1695725.1 hypothetical protein [Pasteurella multocida]HDR1700390.1 hypothetical protein [Pasteurella multocida]HDR1702134.1 hypothetical protein [Pasteurella multocida]HDR1705220.1 hypothetical protein [Pasteurella multocida]